MSKASMEFTEQELAWIDQGLFELLDFYGDTGDDGKANAIVALRKKFHDYAEQHNMSCNFI